MDQEDQGNHNPPWWTRSRFCILLMSPTQGEVDEHTPIVKSLPESGALNEEREGKVCGSLAEAGLAYGGAQATRRAARRLLYLRYETTRGRQASLESMEVGVEKKLLLVYRWTLCQKLSMPLRGRREE